MTGKKGEREITEIKGGGGKVTQVFHHDATKKRKQKNRCNKKDRKENDQATT